MNSPLKDLEQIQLRQIELGYYQNDTEQIRQILNSIKMIAFENIYKKPNQQPPIIENDSKVQNDDDEIAQFYRNQYKSIDIVERSNQRSRMINKRLFEYQNRNTPKNVKVGLPSLKNSGNQNNSINKVTKAVFTPFTERVKLDNTKTLLNKTMQQTLNDFSQQWIKNENHNSPSILNNVQNLKQGQSLFMDELSNRAKSIIESATITKKLKQTIQNSQEIQTSNNVRDQQLATTQIQLGNLSFQVPKCNQFLVDQEMRILRSRIAKRMKPNILVIDQRRMQV
ncbi:unnamed protein product (macronuclear) [Paramecium tetraurelia]|uniref:Uncharacterized protein n=1 Tax=Paramecium tetraurelia TaxID=5888 RepID=A0E085_PARTE|nr:uncharacterized protein GSPATT00021870001 [Paramecium tetraurelia]CAK88702.1 unnamed protein product [Paramecium tetraurelia]|eukprot:XP_001456099.1 hypothetical protein (macronuclear) [Paramecium tetraurelia strain d4-2]